VVAWWAATTADVILMGRGATPSAVAQTASYVRFCRLTGIPQTCTSCNLQTVHSCSIILFKVFSTIILESRLSWALLVPSRSRASRRVRLARPRAAFPFPGFVNLSSLSENGANGGGNTTGKTPKSTAVEYGRLMCLSRFPSDRRPRPVGSLLFFPCDSLVIFEFL